MEQPFTDILIRIRKGSRASYPVEAWLSDGSFYEGKAQLTKALRQDLLESDNEPVQYGSQLFKALFHGPILTAYKVAKGLARQQSDGRLRIRLLLDESAPAELHALKWERVADPQGISLAISELTPFLRYAALPEAELGQSRHQAGSRATLSHPLYCSSGDSHGIGSPCLSWHSRHESHQPPSHGLLRACSLR